MKKILLSLFSVFGLYSVFAQTITINDDALAFNQFDANATFNISVLTNDSGTIDPLSVTISVNPDPLVTTAVASVNPDGTITISNWDNNDFTLTYNVCNDGNPSLECLSANVSVNYACQATTNSILASNCVNYTAPDSQVYTTSGIYTAIIPNSAGCDSTITIDLTILNPTTSTISPSSCLSYTAPDAQVYTNSGSYIAVIPNMAGCDSTITINLTITNPSSSTISASSCGSYTAPDAQVYSASGTYTAIIPNMEGCDSTITINLTITTPTSSTISATECATYTAPDGQIYTTSGTKTAIIPNVNGCDSTITINLTINPNPVATASAQGNTTITVLPAGMIYQWINCNTDQEISSATNQIIEPMSGSYAAIVTNNNGCVDTSNCVTVTNTANLDLLNTEVFNLFPNPTNGKITVNSPKMEHNKLTISDMNGRNLIENIAFTSEIEMDLSSFETGVYFIFIENSNSIQKLKIVKE